MRRRTGASGLWLAVSLVAIGLDGAALVKALKVAAPAAKVFSETGSAAKFEETLAKATELSEGVRNALNKQAKAEEAFTRAAEDLSNYVRVKLYSGLDPISLDKVRKAARRKFVTFRSSSQSSSSKSSPRPSTSTI